jgi:hypothetical protein
VGLEAQYLLHDDDVCTSGGSSFWWMALIGLAISERHCRGVRWCMLLNSKIQNLSLNLNLNLKI